MSDDSTLPSCAKDIETQILNVINESEDGKLTYHQIADKLKLKNGAFTYVLNLIKKKKIDMIQEGNLMVYKTTKQEKSE